MKRVMCFGTFDLLHLGHLNYFKQAKKLADYLIVVIARDVTKKKQKKEAVFSEKERLELVKNLRIVDEAILGYPTDHYKVIKEKNPDFIFLGYDHKVKEKDLKKNLLERGINISIKRAKPYKIGKHKSTKIKEKILNQQ